MHLDHTTTILARLGTGRLVADQVRNLLCLTLKQQVHSSQMVVGILGLSSRTLQRKLDEEGTY